jgi:hypothetical protein
MILVEGNMKIYNGIRNLEKKFPDLVGDEDWETLKLFLEPYEYLNRDDIAKSRNGGCSDLVVDELETLWPDLIRMLKESRDRGEWVSWETFNNLPIVMAKFLLAIRVNSWFDGCFGNQVEEEYLKLVSKKEDEL